MSDDPPEIRLFDSLAEISAADWDAMAAPEQATGRPEDPFTTHRFLMALETSGSTGKGTGWQFRPMVLIQNGKPLAALPLYVKSNSQGEYIFDHAWADAYERAGGRYYPKLQVAVPFTPVPGRRFLGPEIWRPSLASAAIGLTRSNDLSSLHFTFCTEDEASQLDGHDGLLRRTTHQYHWKNRDYKSYDDFLADLSSRKRKALRKERQTALASGLTIRSLTGDQILPEYWDAFWQFYQDTGARKWGRPYLTRAAFDAFHATMRDDMLLVLAFRDATPIAGALNFIGRTSLFGRYWGAVEDHPALHFELCYHRAIDWAIDHNLARVEAGAQGDHKLARGYLPVETHSLHWIADPGFRRAVAEYLAEERRAVRHEIEALADFSPFRQDGPS